MARSARFGHIIRLVGLQSPVTMLAPDVDRSRGGSPLILRESWSAESEFRRSSNSRKMKTGERPLCAPIRQVGGINVEGMVPLEDLTRTMTAYSCSQINHVGVGGP